MRNIKSIKKNLEELIRGKKAVLLFTGDKGSTLLINIVSDMDVNTIFIDTGFHFDEIVNYIEKLDDKIEIVYNHVATIDSSVDMHQCCYQRKIEVLREYLSNVRSECLIVPFTGEEMESGIEESYLNGIENIEIIKPLAGLTEREIWIMIDENKMLFSSIYKRGFKVIDCKCCTTRIGRKRPGEEQRSSDMDKETVEKLKSLGYM